MEVAEKLKVLLEHWIEHNAAHGEEFEKWAQRAKEAGLKEVSGDISAAAENLQKATRYFHSALIHLEEISEEEPDVPE